MERPATWKIITVGAALTGLGIVGAGTASAAITPTAVPAGIEAPQFTAFDDDWTETYWDDNAAQRGDDWTETYWDD